MIKKCHGCEKDFATECPEDNYCRTCRGDPVHAKAEVEKRK